MVNLNSRTLLSLALIGAFFMLAMTTGKPLLAQDEGAALPPSAPLKVVAEADRYGAHIEWSAAEPGTNPVNGYHIWRKNGDADFANIATISAPATDYTDPDFSPGESYRITAIDDQDPPNESAPSDVVTVSSPNDEATSAPVPVDAPASVNVEKQHPQSEPVPSTGEPDVDSIQAALNQGDIPLVETGLLKLQDSGFSSLRRLASPSSADKAAAVKDCDSKDEALTLVYLGLPDDLQMRALQAMAPCYLLENQ